MTEQNYKIAYVTPGIEKVSTDFVLSPLKIDNRWREIIGKEYFGVYFIQSAEGFIKIGKSNDIFKRLGNYRTHHPMTRLVGFISPALNCVDYNENLLQRLWEPFIVSLEWFAPVRPLIQYIRAFDKDGFGFPLELAEPEPSTWQELLQLQLRIEGVK